ncbi:MAG TPA: EAL domain-containing protein [Kofleriaceae bacterium]|nr:EAL domain-containing protein [Kofleriaceae bacterium]
MQGKGRPTVIKVPPVIPRARTAPPAPSADTANQLARGTEPQLHSIDQTSQTDRLRELEDKLARSVSSLTMHFQPIVRAETRARFGYEALMRSTDRALPHPGAVLDAAERLEKVTMLGRAIRAQTAKVIADAPTSRGLVFVNLHMLDFHDKQLTSTFAPLSKVASRVVLEITERTSLQGQDDLPYRLAELRELGFKIAIDDLGGGHARMGTFSPFDADFVKLDMSLVRDLDRQPLKQQLVRSIIEVCSEGGTQVIGEGVETDAEAQTLVHLGCHLLQGYLIAKPALPFSDPL